MSVFYFEKKKKGKKMNINFTITIQSVFHIFVMTCDHVW